MKSLKDLFLAEKNVMIVILINAIIICTLYFPEFSENQFLIFLDHFFIVFFMLEAIIKIYHLKPRVYFSSRWNQFDFLIVVVSLPSLMMSFIEIPDTSWLLILRLFRLVRLIRFIHFVPNLTKIIVGLGRALKASVFVLLALFFLNFLLSIFTCHFYAKIAPEYFGNPLISSYSIFQMFTVEGWNEIPATIADKMQENSLREILENAGMAVDDTLKSIDEYPLHIQQSYDSIQRKSSLLIGLTRFYFVLIVLIGGIFGMSLANAVFVDEMTMDNNDVIEKKMDLLHAEIAELKELLKKQ